MSLLSCAAISVAMFLVDDATFDEQIIPLDNGVTAHVISAPDASHHAIFTFIPSGLASDAKGEAQFSHLVEHMLIRSSVPVTLNVDGVRYNGETTGSWMRLESIGPPEKWKEALATEAGWMGVTTVDPEVLEIEKVRLLQELDGTVPLGYTAKWAIAAWNQVVRHGALDVAVRGDVEGASAAAVEAAIRNRVAIGKGVHVISVGPVDSDDVAKELARVTGGVASRGAAGPAVATVKPLRTGDLEATWDLEAYHYLKWFPLPDDRPIDRLAARVVAQIMMVEFYQRTSRLGRRLLPSVSSDLVTPEGRFLLFSIGGIHESEIAKVRELVDATIEGGAAAIADLPMDIMLRNFGGQFIDPPDFASMRRAYAGRPGGDWIEAQAMLTRKSAQLDVGTMGDELGALFAELGGLVLVDLAETAVARDASSLLLRPRTKEE